MVKLTVKSVKEKKLKDIKKDGITFTIWLVNGPMIRGINGRRGFYQDFTEGGNSARYKFIPDSPNPEIWIESDVRANERKHIIIHEVNEYLNMKQGMSYNKAHLLANRKESISRGLSPGYTKRIDAMTREFYFNHRQEKHESKHSHEKCYHKQMAMGMKDEMHEHSMSREEARKTVLDHLREDIHYYIKLKQAGLLKSVQNEGMPMLLSDSQIIHRLRQLFTPGMYDCKDHIHDIKLYLKK